jgi:hypothetical protein
LSDRCSGVLQPAENMATDARIAPAIRVANRSYPRR